MIKYDKKLIIDYINGDDLEEFTIDELENDAIFMLEVIKFSNDKKMYNLCSDEVKKDYNLVKFLVLKFKNDIGFITMVADYFLDNTDTDLERTELLIIMSELTKNERSITKYDVLSEAIFSGKRLGVELYKLKNKDDETANEIGMGFSYIFDSYNSSQIVLNFYAEKIIDDIFSEYDIDLESMLHNQFITPEKINEYGLNNYMINFIEMYDSMLSSYVSTHLDVLSSFSKRILEVQKKWDSYIDIEEESRYNLMIEKVEEYMASADSLFGEMQLMYHIGSKLGILDKIIRYDYVSESLYETIKEDASDDFINQTLEISFIDRIHYQNVKNIMINTIFPNKSGLDLVDEEEKSEKGKILKIDFSNKKND